MMIKVLKFIACSYALSLSTAAFASCPSDDATQGTVEANIVGIEYIDGCTYLLLQNEVSTHPNHDSGQFLAGRYKYLALDQSNESKHDNILSLATTALATNMKVHSKFTGRTGIIATFSLMKQ